MEHQTSKALIAGILNIVSGVSALIGAFVLGLLGTIGFGVLQTVPDREANAFAFVPPLFFYPLTLFMLVIGAAAVIGGIAAVRRRSFGLAIFGTIASILSCFFLGIPAMVLLVLGESEFRGTAGHSTGLVSS